MVPTFTVVRSTGEAPGFAPAVSSWLRRRPSPRPARPDTYHRPDSSPRRAAAWLAAPTRLRTAHQPRSTGFELVDDEEALRHRFLTYTFPSCSPGTARPVVPDRPDFVAAAPTLPGVPQGQAAASFTQPLRRRSDARSLTSIRNNSASWRTTCSSTPTVSTPSSRSGSSASDGRRGLDRVPAGVPVHSEPAGHRGDRWCRVGCGCRPPRRPAGQLARGGASSWSSLNPPTRQAGSPHR